MHRRFFARSAISMQALAGGGGELLRRRGERADGVLQGNRTLTREREAANMQAARCLRHFRRNQEVEVNAERREKLEINSPPGCTGQ